MKGLALEVIIQWVILSVVALVVIGLVFTFSDDIKRYLSGWFGNEQEIKTEKVTSDSFSTSEIITFAKACWSSTGEKYEENIICYILTGDVSNVDKDMLEDSLDSPAKVDVSEFDLSKSLTIIRFEDVGNIVYIESS